MILYSYLVECVTLIALSLSKDGPPLSRDLTELKLELRARLSNFVRIMFQLIARVLYRIIENNKVKRSKMKP